MKKVILLALIGLFLFIPTSFARDVVSDWYIKNLKTEIIVNTDSSLLITEHITADCGNLPNKHGIFRTLPLQTKTPEKTISSPIELISITDFNGTPYKYSTTKQDNTITWKIGDANKTVSGINNYKIVYRVENVIRFDDSEFDELYWNVVGAFWDLEIDSTFTEIILPKKADRNNSQVSVYSGDFNSKTNTLASYGWYTNDILQIYSATTLKENQGITVSIAMPKNIFTPYKPGFFEEILKYLLFLIPIIVFIVCFVVWKKYGKDPKINKTIIPEFEIPDNLTPMEMGMLINNGKWNQDLVSASIIDLAVKGLIVIREIEDKILFIKNKDYLLENKSSVERIAKISITEKLIMEGIFNDKKEVKLSSLKMKFYKYVPPIISAAKDNLAEKKLINPKGLSFQVMFVIIASIAGALSFIFYYASLALIPSAIIIFIFSFLMPSRTPKGAELNWRIKGFKLYMETAEKYRQQFNEKENIFEKLLPYAMIFGLTKLWIKKFEQIYGKDYFVNYHPIWFVGSLGSFDINNFASELNGISSAISSNVGNSSGFGGGGSSGGGGGGGGGGGW